MVRAEMSRNEQRSEQVRDFVGAAHSVARVQFVAWVMEWVMVVDTAGMAVFRELHLKGLPDMFKI